jgi:large subunit ribosomal protein L11
MAQKKQAKTIKIVIKAGAANPAPPVGSTLGPYGINLMQFCQEFNKLTASMQGNVPAEVTINPDRSFSLVIKTPAVSELIKQATKLSKGSGDQKVSVGKIEFEAVKDIALKKQPDLNAFTPEGAIKMILGTCKSMGVKVIDLPEEYS